jgi:S1-C subfamily serine protease
VERGDLASLRARARTNLDVLAPFVVRIDYPHKRLWLRRVGTEPIRFQGADYGLAKQTGVFMTEIPNGQQVWGVTPGSPAAKLGVRVGDVIVSSENNKPPPPDEVLHRILDGKELQVARKQGELWVDTVLPEAPQEPAAN